MGAVGFVGGNCLPVPQAANVSKKNVQRSA